MSAGSPSLTAHLPRDDEGRLAAALQAAGVGTWRIDTAADQLELSTQMRRLLGVDPPTSPVDPEALEGTLGDEEQGRIETEFAAALSGDSAINGAINLDVEVNHADGRRRWLQIAGSLERVPSGTGTCRGSGIALDITERKRAEQRLAVRDTVSRTIAGADTLDEAAPQVLAAIAAGIDMDICALWLPTAPGERLECAYRHVADPDDAAFGSFLRQTDDARYRPEEGLPGRVWRTHAPVWVESVEDGVDFERLASAWADGLTSGLAVPLLAGSVMVGVIEVFARRPPPPDDELAETLAGLGQKLAQFILRMRAESRLREGDARQRLRVAILEAHRDAADPESAIRVTAEALGRHLAASRAGFVELVGEEVVFLSGWAADPAEALAGSLSTSTITAAFLSELLDGRVLNIADAQADPRNTGSRLDDLGVRSLIAVPVMRTGRWISSLYVHDVAARQWTRAEVRLVEEVADYTWDTVERLRAEKERHESEAMAHAIADNSSQAMVLMDRRGYVRYANAACLEMTGFEGEDIMERPLHDLIHHHDPEGRPYPRSQCPIEQALTQRSGIRDHETIFFRKDGSAFPALCTVSPAVRAGRAGSTIVEIRDVSASRAAALALAASEKQFRGTFENAAVGVAHVAIDGRWLRVNRRLCEIVGHDESELLARTFADITHPDDLEIDLQQVQRMLAGEIGTYTLDKRYLHKDGAHVWVELTVSLARDDDGQPEYFIAIVSDASERKRAESRLRTALAVKEEFLGLVSHELRTPMTVIQGMSEILAGGALEGDRARSIAADIADAAHELDELVESMLLLARLDRDEEAVYEPITLGRVAAESIERQRRRDPSRRYRLTEVGGAIVEANPGLIDRVITNLLVNAAKYSLPGADIEVVIEADQSEARLRVLDAGPGLSDDELERVFEPFYRAPARTAAPGAGLGLSVASRIMESLGGRMWAKRTEDGSDFGFGLARLVPDED